MPRSPKPLPRAWGKPLTFDKLMQIVREVPYVGPQRVSLCTQFGVSMMEVFGAVGVAPMIPPAAFHNLHAIRQRMITCEVAENMASEH